ncbi:MAG: molybdenum cofactor guanylyltransferase [Chloroflexi bacterium]|nr:molybdenum cofactor guanylyltransferase [Chloroflexota bacterium]
MSVEAPLAGVVLAGGESRRLGVDKALLTTFHSKPLLLHVLDTVRTVCDEVVVVVDRADRYADLELDARVATDRFPGRGPLGGVHAGLSAVESPFALVVACDMPFLNLDLLRYMAGFPRHYEALVPVHRGRWQPLHAIYARTCRSAAEAALVQGEQQVLDLLKRLRVRPVGLDELRPLDRYGFSFFNVNEPEDLVRARFVRKRMRSGVAKAKSA